MPEETVKKGGMNETDVQLLKAIHTVDKKVDVRFAALESKIDNSVEGRFKDMDRRIGSLEGNQKWLVFGILGFVLARILEVTMK